MIATTQKMKVQPSNRLKAKIASALRFVAAHRDDGRQEVDGKADERADHGSGFR
jgi:hypothetical protein